MKDNNWIWYKDWGWVYSVVQVQTGLRSRCQSQSR